MQEREYSGIKNSIAPNIIEDDKTMKNYLALAKCISGIEVDGEIKYPSISQVVNAYQLYDKANEETNKQNLERKEDRNVKVNMSNRKCNKNLKYILENIKTGEKIECHGVTEVVDKIGIDPTYIPTYISMKMSYKKTWKIQKAHEGRGRFTRYVKITNIKTQHVEIAKSIKDAAKYIKKSTCYS